VQKPNSVIVYMATTSIYWRSRLDKSDQQSAAIFIAKTRQVAVYVETHYTLHSKTAFSTGVTDM